MTNGTIGRYDVDSRVRVGQIDRAAQALGSPTNASVSADGTRVYLMDVRTGAGIEPRCEVHTLDLETERLTGPTIELDGCGWIGSVTDTRDGSRIAITYSGSTTWATVIHDGRTSEQVGGPILGHRASSIAPDGTLVGGGINGEVTQYDLETLEPIGTFPGARGTVDWLSFSADGSLLLVESRNQILSIYDVATRTRLGDPIVTDAWFDGTKGTLRPDGKAVAINSGDGFTIWDLDPDHLADAACRVAGRNLTCAEWATHLGTATPYRTTCPDTT